MLITTRAVKLLVASILLGGCVNPVQQTEIGALRQEVADLQGDIAALQTDIVHRRSNDASAHNAAAEDMAMKMETHLAVVTGSLNTLSEQMEAACRKPQAIPVTQCNEEAKTIVLHDDKMVVGEVEKIWVDPPGFQMDARVDTGADTSSLHAENVTEFERDGSDWVRFDVIVEKVNVTIERPVKRYVKVYQQSDKDGTRRPVVEMRIFVGDVKETFAFTLADRSGLDQAMTLGKNFLTDMALVDVGRKFVQPAFKPKQR